MEAREALKRAALKKALDLLRGADSAPFPEAARLTLEARRVLRPHTGCGKVAEVDQAILSGKSAYAIGRIRLVLGSQP